MMIGEKCADMLKEDARGAERRRSRGGERSIEYRLAAAARGHPLPAGASAVRRARPRRRRARRGGRRGRVPPRRHDDLLPGRRAGRAPAGGPQRRGRDRATTAACSTCSARASCSATRRCCRGCPTGFEARAAEDTLCYRIRRRDRAASCSSRPAGLRFVARSLLEPPAERRRGPRASPAATPPTSRSARCCAASRWSARPDTSIREAARADDRGRTRRSVVVELGDGALGILTDRDLRTRVVADGLAGRRTRFGGDVGARVHVRARPARRRGAARDARPRLPPLPGRRRRRARSSGVVEDIDLVAAQTRSSFFLRQRIAARRSRRRARRRRARAAARR